MIGNGYWATGITVKYGYSGMDLYGWAAQVIMQGRADQTLLHLIAHEIIEREDIARVLGHRAL